MRTTHVEHHGTESLPVAAARERAANQRLTRAVARKCRPATFDRLFREWALLDSDLVLALQYPDA